MNVPIHLQVETELAEPNKEIAIELFRALHGKPDLIAEEEECYKHVLAHLATLLTFCVSIETKPQREPRDVVPAGEVQNSRDEMPWRVKLVRLCDAPAGSLLLKWAYEEIIRLRCGFAPGRVQECERVGRVETSNVHIPYIHFVRNESNLDKLVGADLYAIRH